MGFFGASDVEDLRDPVSVGFQGNGKPSGAWGSLWCFEFHVLDALLGLEFRGVCGVNGLGFRA